MGTGKFNAGVNPAMDRHPFQGGEGGREYDMDTSRLRDKVPIVLGN